MKDIFEKPIYQIDDGAYRIYIEHDPPFPGIEKAVFQLALRNTSFFLGLGRYLEN